jgi:hypothetical protein
VRFTYLAACFIPESTDRISITFGTAFYSKVFLISSINLTVSALNAMK